MKIFISLVLLMVLVGTAVGCATPATPAATAPAAKTTPATTPAQAPTPTPEKPITLKVSVFSGPTGGIADAMKVALAEAEKLGKGRLKFDVYWSGLLTGQRDTGTGIQKGLADIGYYWYPADPVKLPLSQATVQLGITHTFWSGAKAIMDFMELEPIKKEWTNLNLKFLWPAGSGANYIYLGNKPAKTIEDLKKLRIYGGSPVPEILSNLGMTAIELQTTEIYEALLRGTIDATFFPANNVPLYKFQEVCKYYNQDIPGFGSKMYATAMNLEVFNKLPKDLQQALTGIDSVTIFHRDYAWKLEKNGLDMIKKANLEELHSPPEVSQTFNEKGVLPTLQSYLNDTKKAGLPGQEMLDKWIELNKKYEPLYPAEAKKQGWD